MPADFNNPDRRAILKYPHSIPLEGRFLAEVFTMLPEDTKIVDIKVDDFGRVNCMLLESSKFPSVKEGIKYNELLVTVHEDHKPFSGEKIIAVTKVQVENNEGNRYLVEKPV